MWIKGNYRRNLMDMHIDDWNPDFLSKINVNEYVEALKDAGVQAAMVKGKPHTGLCYYPTKIGRMHKGLRGYDFFGDMVQKCHENGIAVEGYFTQIFDNWAYEEHPEWRLVTSDGMNMREYRETSNFKTGRYGIVCPNNEEYRQYVKSSLEEMIENYKFEGIFLDMTFWPDICYCPSCRKKYKEQTGKEIPRKIDWEDPDFKEFVYIRDKWMAEYAQFATHCVKNVCPDMTVEHQFSRITCSWIDGSTEMLTDAVDYCGGDYYGGFMQQSFINKYYKNVSPNLPFIYHTSRCDPELVYHTTTKTKEELLLHVITALVHNGAFLLVDAINPDGSIVPEVYHGIMKEVYGITKQYEKYVSGELIHDVAIWFASHAKYDPDETGISVRDKSFEPKFYIDAPIAAASIMRENNIPYEVIGTKNIKTEKAKLLILSHVANIREEEMDEIEKYIEKGGNLLISGPVSNERLQKMLGIRITGKTEHKFTYMSPTPEGEKIFENFSKKVPLTIPMAQYVAEITEKDTVALATLTLPYTMTNTQDFAAIHSNPPGIYTKIPCCTIRKYKDSTLIWTAAPIEMSKPYLSKQIYKKLVQYLAGNPSFTSNAPKCVEVLCWNKGDETYFAVINEQEESPIVPMYDITIELPYEIQKAQMLPSESAIKTEKTDSGTRIFLPKLDVFQMIHIVK